MKPGSFALNPYAASYVPLSKRVDYAGEEELISATPSTDIVQDQQYVSNEFGTQGSFPGVELSEKSSDMASKQMIREDNLDLEMDIDMDIEYLLSSFSGLSQESLTDVYLANNGDLEATIDMLNQLEIFSSDYLPDTLDIGDISESSTPSTSKTSKQKNTATEVSVPSSGNPNAPVSF